MRRVNDKTARAIPAQAGTYMIYATDISENETLFRRIPVVGWQLLAFESYCTTPLLPCPHPKDVDVDYGGHAIVFPDGSIIGPVKIGEDTFTEPESVEEWRSEIKRTASRRLKERAYLEREAERDWLVSK